MPGTRKAARSIDESDVVARLRGHDRRSSLFGMEGNVKILRIVEHPHFGNVRRRARVVRSANLDSGIAPWAQLASISAGSVEAGLAAAAAGNSRLVATAAEAGKGKSVAAATAHESKRASRNFDTKTVFSQ